MSTRTVGYMLLQLLTTCPRPAATPTACSTGRRTSVDRPLADDLERLGVELRLGCRSSDREPRAPRDVSHTVECVRATAGSRTRRTTTLRRPGRGAARAIAIDALKAAEPALANLDQLQVRWMNGIKFYLTRDVPLVTATRSTSTRRGR